ncbi:hypothetical protein AGDE_14363 [Angomonas deanei]|uniref:Pentacotripeptide-repeat region of PRORP/Pentatricopeptide repeat domain/PPR repeat family/PPR repeat, putative n=1 Tax=Angomonas deanei TaxID=59799 RepID=A0A7G2CAU5_9TRYP|nr:hypothetical protein AGDE_14363 [Angomonas deanei]CAD2215873.1 Pentacotripeptide-repeat region of PRORP/Pentatricopeptide repeat domain/PPR repeat family/PPR repeat, putative [Angomonas deanei]|eukprot:EPY20987.1 hypothetical protein AGDE_14363 [Angomonas deanei]
MLHRGLLFARWGSIASCAGWYGGGCAKRYLSSSSDTSAPTPAEEVENLFYNSVMRRTVSNLQVRKYIQKVETKDYLLALAAVKGSRRAGLNINNGTYESLIKLLIEAGQLKAAMELYQQMLKKHIVPTPNTYSMLMNLCLQRDMPESCQTLYKEMLRLGGKPPTSAYAALIQSYATQVPSKWEAAIEVFDKMNKHSQPDADTYNALMRVYMNMRPYDWRVVYNCYYEMRNREPRVQLKWSSYYILSEALRKGNAGVMRRFISYCDAWVALTPLFSAEFFLGVVVFGVVFLGSESVNIPCLYVVVRPSREHPI